MKKSLNIVSGAGLFLILLAAIFYFVGANFRDKAELTVGKVTGFRTSVDSDDNSVTYCPIVNFSTNGGQPVTYNSHVCNSPPAHEVGEEVQIYYDPEDPERAQIKDFWSQYLVITILSCIGLPFVVFGRWISVGS